MITSSCEFTPRAKAQGFLRSFSDNTRIQMNQLLSNFDLISDLHIERRQLVITRNPTSKYLVIAGDIMDFGAVTNNYKVFKRADQKIRHDLLKEFIGSVSTQYEKIFYVLGNHEYWLTDLTTAANEIKQWLKLNKFDNVYVLDNERYEVENVSILGTTLWTDARRGDPSVMAAITVGMNDYRKTYNERNLSGYMKVEDTVEQHSIARQWLIDELQTCSADKPALIVTHHHPVVNITGAYDSSILMLHAYGSDMSDVICDYEDRIAGWCCGHVHDRVHAVPYMSHVDVICYPRGYYGLETAAYEYEPLNLGTVKSK